MSRTRYKRTWKEFGSRQDKTKLLISFTQTWNSPGRGRYWKSKLNRARRKYYKLHDNGFDVKYPVYLESEVNWKSW